MRRGLGLCVLAALLVAACGGSAQRTATTRVTVGPRGPLDAALLTLSQIRQVPGLATAKVAALAQPAALDNADPRGPCGANVPRISLTDAAGIAITGDNLRGGAQFVVRLPAGAAKRYLDARQADTSRGCAAYETKTAQGVTQRVQLVRIVRLHREFEQAVAVVSALTVGDRARAETQIEVRRGDILSRTLIYTNAPLGTVTVRGVASLMGQNLLVFDQ